MFENDKAFKGVLERYFSLNEDYLVDEKEIIKNTENYKKDILNDGKIHFYLPGFYYHFDLNMELLNLMKEHPEFFYDNIEIGAVYDTFPYSIWSGGRFEPSKTSGMVQLAEMKYIIDSYNVLGIPIRYVYTNSCLEEKHLFDTYCNLTMEVANNGYNEVLVNSPILETYIRETYPNYKIIKSTTACERDVDKFNESLERYHMCVMDFRDNKNPEFIDKLKNRNKIEILLNELCGEDCPMRKEHYRILSLCNLAFIDSSVDCRYSRASAYGIEDLIINNPNTVISREELYNRYVRLGFNNFKIEGRRSITSLVIDSYAYYLAKPEFSERIKTYLTTKLLMTNREHKEALL